MGTNAVQEDLPYIRWMIRRDLARVLEIETESFPFPWCEDDFCNVLRQRSMIGMVIEVNDDVVGYVIYDLAAKFISIINLAIDPAHRRKGLGRMLLAKLESKLSTDRRQAIFCDVWERNIEAQKFFRACKWKCRAVVADRYTEVDRTREDAYQFVRRACEVQWDREKDSETRKLSNVGSTKTT